MTLALQLVTYHSTDWLVFLLDSLVAQTDQDWHLHVLDNSTTEVWEQTQGILLGYADRLSMSVQHSDTNCGFAGGHQQLFTQHQAELVQLVNPDTLLEPTYLADIRREMTQRPKVGSASGVVLRWWPESGVAQRSDVVDSLGLQEHMTGRVVDAGSGTHKIPSVPQTVLGVSGCLPMVRRAAVETACMEGRLFDPTYVIYKEDIDLAYSLRAHGWVALIVPTIAYHARGFKPGGRGSVSRTLQYYSYRNHVWNLYTHRGRSAAQVLCITVYEAAKLLYMLVFHPSIVRDTIRATASNWEGLKKKRAFYAN